MQCARETEILVEQQPPQGAFICDHAGFVITKFSRSGGQERLVAPAPHLAHPEGCAALRIVLGTVLRVSRSCEHFLDGFDLHLLQGGQES